MATTLKSFDFSKASDLTKAEKGAYPWDDWLNGDIWQITQGEDFQPHPLMMERIIRTRATGRGAKIRLRHVPVNGGDFGVIVLQRRDIVGPSEAKATEAKEKRQAAATARKQAKMATEAEAPAAPKPAKRTRSKTVAEPVAETPTKRPSKRPSKAA